MNVQVRIPGTEHWTNKGDVKLFLWNKVAGDPARTRGTILFVHGSSMASQPTFDWKCRAGRIPPPWSTSPSKAMTLVRRHGGLRPLHQGARQQLADLVRRRRCQAAATYIQKLRGRARCWSTACRPVRCAPRCSPNGIPRWSTAWCSTPWCGPAKAPRRWPTGASGCRNPVEEPPADRSRLRAFDLQPRPPGTAEDSVIDAFADAILKLDEAHRHLRRHVFQAAGENPERIKVRRSSCAANGTGSRASTTWSSSSSGCPTRRSSSP